MALPLYERALDDDSSELVRLTLVVDEMAATTESPLIPSRLPESGEQYRFHFDMTRCIGCRSCEVACNEQNGNPANIHWRRVGELEGGVYPDTQRTYLSMGCNHCLSAECLKGCPVDAYHKDPLTGVVMHSADACIGCQYCVWNCPYSVPQFNPERGVVGKCDMCHGRLIDALEPACVTACPENAIQIEIVNTLEWRNDFAKAESPGMPPAGHTVSTTRITLPTRSSSWLERVDTGAIPLQHAHASLVAMTTAMQATFGTLTVLVLRRALNTVNITIVAALTAIALNISVFHLGRPAYAWRALKMWRRSWLSREVLFFSLFFASIGVCAIASWAATLGVRAAHGFVYPSAVAGILFGVCGTLASAYIYLVPARPAWNTVHTPLDFLLSAGLIGTALVTVMQTPVEVLVGKLAGATLLTSSTPTRISPAYVGAFALAWTVNHCAKLIRLRSSATFEERASFHLLRGDSLWWVVALSFMAALATPLFVAAPLPSIAFGTALIAVVLQRYLFFVSVVPLSMGLTFMGSNQASHSQSTVVMPTEVVA